ncbi:MAG: hypothetical protein H7321_04875 [Bacteroidia bacterium]|nr:hypothetical protein [Bacteroidia bacterium]
MQANNTQKWEQITNFVELNFDKKPDLNAILFLIGIRELGELPSTKFKKEEKVNLMHIAICRLFSLSGYYELEGKDKDGWPHWKLIKTLPNFSIFEQETFIRQHIIEYFEQEEII